MAYLTTFAFASLNSGPTSTLNSRDLPPLNPPESAIINLDLSVAVAEPQTNAKRLAAGLPPMRPAKMWTPRKQGESEWRFREPRGAMDVIALCQMLMILFVSLQKPSFRGHPARLASTLDNIFFRLFKTPHLCRSPLFVQTGFHSSEQ